MELSQNENHAADNNQKLFKQAQLGYNNRSTMGQVIRFSAGKGLPILIGSLLLALFVFVSHSSALTPLPTPEPKPGSYGLEARKTKAPPTSGATITTPGSGGSFTTSPITVSGICPDGLLVQVYNNSVMVGSVMCEGGSFSLQVSLFPGTNELSAMVFDEVDQTGPESNIVTVNFTDTNFSAFGQSITLTSSYGRRSAGVNTALSWPLQLSGGTGPYAFSIDWGDSTEPELKSQALAGVVTISHIYKKAGIYRVNIKVTDANNVSAFLQVIAVSNGKVDGAAATDDPSENANQTQQIMWAPTGIALFLLFPTFWLGRKSQLTSIRNKMLKERDSIQQK